MGEIFIRKIQEKDLETITDIQITNWQSAYRGIIDDSFLDNMNKEALIAKRKNRSINDNFIVAIKDNEVVGFRSYIAKSRYTSEKEEIDCEIMAIYVKIDMQQKGIGRKMVEYVISDFKNLNKKKMIIWCLKENYPSRKFYEKIGGKIEKEQSVNIDGKDYQEIGFTYNIQ